MFLQESLEKHLCYNKELWDGIPLSDWPEDVILPGEIRSDVAKSSSNRWGPPALVVQVVLISISMIFIQ